MTLFCLNKYSEGFRGQRSIVDNVYSAEAGTHLAQQLRLVGDYSFIGFHQPSFYLYGKVVLSVTQRLPFHLGPEIDVFDVLMLRCCLCIISTRGATSVGEIIMFGATTVGKITVFGATTVRKFQPLCFFIMI